MSKSKRSSKKAPSSTASPGSERATKKQPNPHATRETVESIVVAVILAFLFRAFIAEAFVIPTGSMAPTLFGRNKDVVCPQCGYAYATGASSEVPRHRDDRRVLAPLSATYCPICRYGMQLDPETQANERSFGGDRILVSKFAYAMSDPERWDVIVFKFPGNAKLNYIKRLIGLPNEAVQIRHGDIHAAPLLFRVPVQMPYTPDMDVVRSLFAENGVRLSDSVSEQSAQAPSSWALLLRDGDREYGVTYDRIQGEVRVYGDSFEIQRKPPHKLAAMLQIVDDTKHRGTALQMTWPSRWHDWSGQESWSVDADESIYETQGSGNGTAWLRYRHLIPSDNDWKTILAESLPQAVAERPGRLIDDHYAYNDFLSFNGRQPSPAHWVGDLAVECTVAAQSESGNLLLDLVEGGAHYRCTIDVATGKAVLSILNGEAGFSAPGSEQVQATVQGETPFRADREHTLRFANVDDQLTLWVDGRVIAFDGPTTYQSRGEFRPFWSETDPGDAEPAGVGSDGAALSVRRLRVFRDIYYIATTGSQNDYDRDFDAVETQRIFGSPREWATTSLFTSRRATLFAMQDDQFFPLGDNSPYSQDARTWNAEHYVDRSLMIGKAVLIYWPHPWRLTIPLVDVALPIIPNFQRMRLIR